MKEIHPWEDWFFWLKIIVLNRCEEEKYEENWAIFRSAYFKNYLADFLPNLVFQVVYMEGIKYANLIEIGSAVTKIWGVENGDLVVPVNNTLVYHTSFLAIDTRSCVLICTYNLIITLRQYNNLTHKVVSNSLYTLYGMTGSGGWSWITEGANVHS